MKKRPFFLDFLNLNIRDNHPRSRMDLNLHSSSGEDSSRNDHGNDNHEYHEISDEEVSSPAFDFGPSLMDEVFKELDIVKPDPRVDQETACSNNVKNEMKEIASKFVLGTKDGRKKQGTVKPISAADSQSLESAIAMAKELASRSIMELDGRNDNMAFECPSSADSPKTPNSPNKKSTKFSFKFRNSPKSERRHFSEKEKSERRHFSEEKEKSERRHFSEEKEKNCGLDSIISEEAKEAYERLVERRPSSSDRFHESKHGERRLSSSSSGHNNHSRQVSQESGDFDLKYSRQLSQESDFDLKSGDANPLRLLRNGVNVVPKVRGNKQRVASTPQTASLARLTSTVSGPSRSGLGTPPPPPGSHHDGSNALPLPPRDRNNQVLKAPLKHHQRKHPLLIPQVPLSTSQVPLSTSQVPLSTSQVPTTESLPRDGDSQPALLTFRPHGPILKQVSCPEPPASYLHSISVDQPPTKSSHGKIAPAIPPPPKPSKLAELDISFESEISAAIENLDSLKSFVSERLSNGSNGLNSSNGSNGPNGPNGSNGSVEKATNGNSGKPEMPCLPIEGGATSVSVSSKGQGKSPDSDDIRVMQMVLANEVQLLADECVQLLKKTGGDVHKAIKCVRLREMLKSHSIGLDCNWIQTLEKYKWNVRQASNYLIATQGTGNTTEV